MADNVTVDNGDLTDYDVVTDEITSPYTGGTKQAQGVKLLDGTANATTPIAAGGGTEATALRVTVASDSTGVLSVDDNGGSLTVDGTVAVSGLSGTVAVTQSGTWDEVGINDSGNSITVDDGGSSLTVDGSVTADTELTTADLDTGAGTDTRAVVGLVIAKSGGAANISNSDPLPISDAGGSLTVDGTVAVSGTVAVTQSGAWDEVGINDSGNSITVDDGGSSLTVDGTVTTTPSGDHTVVGKAADGAAVSGNPVLVAGQDGTNVQSLKTDSTGSLQVDVESSALPSGASTAANQSTIIGHLDGVEGLLTTIDADTGTLAGAVAGTEVQVDVVAALPAGTNNIGDVDILSIAAGDNNIGNVDIVSLPASTNTIEIVGDAAHDAAVAGNPVLIGAEFDDTLPDSVDEGDVGRLRISANRNLFTTLRDAAGNERGVNVTAGNALTVDGSAATQPVSHAALTELAAAIDTEVQVDVVGALPAGTNNIGDVDVLSVPADPFGANADAAATAGSTGSIQAKLRLVTSQLDSIKTAVETLDNTVAGNELQVDVLTMPTTAVSQSGTWTVQPGNTANTTAWLVKEQRSGTATHSSVADTATSTTLLSSNTSRLGASITNDSSAVLYVKLGTTASATDYAVRMVQYAYFEVPYGYTGRIDGIWATDPGDGAARIVEFT